MIKSIQISFLFLTNFSLLATAAPSLELIGKSTIDLGTHPTWKRQEAQFTLRNNGDSPGKILKLRKTCGCSEVSADRMEIPPDDISTIKFALLPNELNGSYSKNIFVQTSDPEASNLRLTVTGTAESLLEILPKAKLYAGQLPINKTWKQAFVIRQLGEPVRLGPPQVDNATDTQAELLPPDEKKPKEFTVNLSVTPTKTGSFRRTISIPVLEPQAHPPLSILVYGKVR